MARWYCVHSRMVDTLSEVVVMKASCAVWKIVRFQPPQLWSSTQIVAVAGHVINSGMGTSIQLEPKSAASICSDGTAIPNQDVKEHSSVSAFDRILRLSKLSKLEAKSECQNPVMPAPSTLTCRNAATPQEMVLNPSGKTQPYSRALGRSFLNPAGI